MNPKPDQTKNTAALPCNKRLENLNYLSKSILSLQSSRSIAQLVLTLVQNIVSYARGSVMEFNFTTKKGGVLATQMDYKTKVEPGVQLNLKRLNMSPTTRLAVQLINDLDEMKNPTEIELQLKEEGIRSVLTIPLFAGKELVGLLNLGARKVNAFSREAIEAIEEMAVMLAISIHQSRLAEQTKKDTKTKTILVDEINHRVKNNLSAIIGLLYAKENSFESNKMIRPGDIIHELISSIQGMSTVHQMLSDSEWSPLALSDLSIQIISSVLNTTVEYHVAYDVSPSAVTVIPSQANSIALIINELVINFTKHVLPLKKEARIKVVIKEEENGVVFLFADDGPGFPEDVLKKGRYNTGLFLVSEITKNNLQGDLNLYNRKGGQVKITFPSKTGEG